MFSSYNFAGIHIFMIKYELILVCTKENRNYIYVYYIKQVITKSNYWIEEWNKIQGQKVYEPNDLYKDFYTKAIWCLSYNIILNIQYNIIIFF